MPKLELGDLVSVKRAREANVPVLAALVDAGWDLMALVPSCVLMFKQELPLLFPGDEEVIKVARAFFDPFEYLMARHVEGQFKIDFAGGLGKVLYHASCHQRVQNIGPKTRDILNLVPGTEVVVVERCSGHDGTYGVKVETFDKAMKIARPVIRQIREAEADHYGSDCPIAGHHLANGGVKVETFDKAMKIARPVIRQIREAEADHYGSDCPIAGHHLANGVGNGTQPDHPLSLLRKAYGV